MVIRPKSNNCLPLLLALILYVILADKDANSGVDGNVAFAETIK